MLEASLYWTIVLGSVVGNCIGSLQYWYCLYYGSQALNPIAWMVAAATLYCKYNGLHAPSGFCCNLLSIILPCCIGRLEAKAVCYGLAFVFMPPFPPKGLTAAQMQEQYGDLLRQSPYADTTSPYLLHKALTQRKPHSAVSHGAVKQWWTQY